MKSSNKKIKGSRIIVVVLIIIGAITVLDNIYRLGKEIGRTITHHQWTTITVIAPDYVVVK
jgi:hypothetical protein